MYSSWCSIPPLRNKTVVGEHYNHNMVGRLHLWSVPVGLSAHPLQGDFLVCFYYTKPLENGWGIFGSFAVP